MKRKLNGLRDLHLEQYGTDRMGWMRAAVLNANNGVVSTASLIVGVAAGPVFAQAKCRISRKNLLDRTAAGDRF